MKAYGIKPTETAEDSATVNEQYRNLCKMVHTV